MYKFIINYTTVMYCLLIANHSVTGREHGVGIFVSLVSRGSQADIVGLKVHFCCTCTL